MWPVFRTEILIYQSKTNVDVKKSLFILDREISQVRKDSVWERGSHARFWMHWMWSLLHFISMRWQLRMGLSTVIFFTVSLFRYVSLLSKVCRRGARALGNQSSLLTCLSFGFFPIRCFSPAPCPHWVGKNSDFWQVRVFATVSLKRFNRCSEIEFCQTKDLGSPSNSCHSEEQTFHGGASF